MISRPYRSGAQQLCLICRQPKEIREHVIEMAREHPMRDIAAWLNTQRIEATRMQVRYFLRKSGVPNIKRVIDPGDTYEEKVRTYIGEVLKLRSSTYTLRTLRFRGSAWNVVTKRLHKDGLIEDWGGHPRSRWKILASREEIQEWYENELKKAEFINVTKES